MNVRHYCYAVLLLGVCSQATAGETWAIVGATLHTLRADQPLRNGTVVISDGRIQAVGTDLKPPDGVRVVDAAGRHVTPGLISAGSRLGIVEIFSVDDTNDDAVTTGPLGAAFDVFPAINPNSILLPQARADGLTRAITYPSASAGAPFAGSGALLRLREGPQILERERIALFASIGGMASAQNGGSRAAQWTLLRNALDEARSYRPPRGVGVPRDQLLSRLDIAALLPVVAGRLPLVITADRESDLRQAARLVDDYDLKVIILGGGEAWRVAPLLASRRIAVLIDPFVNLPSSFDVIGARADNAALLEKAGVLFSFVVPGLHQSHDAGAVLREAAGLAVANGLPREAGLRAITANAAMIYGLADQGGAIAPGLDADLVIWDGDPLEPASAPQAVFIDGRELSLPTRQQDLARRYAPAQDSPWPPAYR